MKKKCPLFSVCCVLILILFAAFMFWYVPSIASIRSKTTETRKMLDTSRGREAKQQSEYDNAVEQLPLVRAEVEEKVPLAAAAEENITALKQRRKELRAEKAALETSLSAADPSEEVVPGE